MDEAESRELTCLGTKDLPRVEDKLSALKKELFPFAVKFIETAKGVIPGLLEHGVIKLARRQSTEDKSYQVRDFGPKGEIKIPIQNYYKYEGIIPGYGYFEISGSEINGKTSSINLVRKFKVEGAPREEHLSLSSGLNVLFYEEYSNEFPPSDPKKWGEWIDLHSHGYRFDRRKVFGDPEKLKEALTKYTQVFQDLGRKYPPSEKKITGSKLKQITR